MSENKRFSTELFKKAWLFISSIMTAISLINIGKNLGISIRKWSDFFSTYVDIVIEIRDFILWPFIYVVKNWFTFDFPEAIRNYIFILLLFKSLRFLFWFELSQRRVRWIFFLELFDKLFLNVLLFQAPIVWLLSELLGYWVVTVILIYFGSRMLISLVAPRINKTKYLSIKEAIKIDTSNYTEEELKKLVNRITQSFYSEQFLRIIIVTILIALVNFILVEYEV